MAKFSEKIGYGLGDAAAGGITWKVMSIAFPLFFTNIFGLTVADTATLMLVARLFDVVTDPIMGAIAADLLKEGKSNRVVAQKNGKFVDFDIDEALAMEKSINEYEYEVSKIL